MNETHSRSSILREFLEYHISDAEPQQKCLQEELEEEIHLLEIVEGEEPKEPQVDGLEAN